MRDTRKGYNPAPEKKIETIILKILFIIKDKLAYDLKAFLWGEIFGGFFHDFDVLYNELDTIIN